MKRSTLAINLHYSEQQDFWHQVQVTKDFMYNRSNKFAYATYLVETGHAHCIDILQIDNNYIESFVLEDFRIDEFKCNNGSIMKDAFPTK